MDNNELFTKYELLIENVSKKYCNNFDLDDFKQELSLALLEHITKYYTPERGSIEVFFCASIKNLAKRTMTEFYCDKQNAFEAKFEFFDDRENENSIIPNYLVKSNIKEIIL
jgi:hypothetical protein